MMIQAPNSYRNPYDRKKQNRVNYMIAEAAAGRIQFASKEATAVATPKTKAPALNLDWENEFDEE